MNMQRVQEQRNDSRWSPRRALGFWFVSGVLTWAAVIAFIVTFAEDIMKVIFG